MKRAILILSALAMAADGLPGELADELPPVPKLTYNVRLPMVEKSKTPFATEFKALAAAGKLPPLGALDLNEVVTTSPSATAAGQPPLPTLRWKNGESLQGEIASGSASELTWKTSLFDDPLDLRWNVIDRIDWPSLPVQPAGPFSIALRDGSFLYGDLVSVGADSIAIHSTRHGDVVLLRSEVLAARRLKDGKLLYSGPTGEMGWKPMTNEQDGNVSKNQNLRDITPPLATGSCAALQIRSWNRSAYLDLKLPDRIDVQFRVRSTKRPQFVIGFGGNLRTALRIETWDNLLVLTDADQFKIIRKIEENEREIALHVCWDKKAKQCSVFTSSGEPITSWDVPGEVTETEWGLVLQNRGLDLSLDFLQVRDWDGKAPAKLDPGQPHLELADGRTISGQIAGGAPGSIAVQTAGQTAAADFKIADVDALVFSSDLPQVADDKVTFLYNDGAIIFGRIASMSNASASIATSFTKEPLPSQLELIRKVLLRTPAPKAAPPSPVDQDTITFGQTTLHGQLGTTTNDSIGWTPVGGIKASRPSSSLPSEITRFFPPDAAPPVDPALFYLNSGDVLSGTLRSLDRSGAEFESSIMAPRKLPAAELDAIEFGPSVRLNVHGFTDPGWKIVKGDDKSVRRTGEDLQMDPGTAIACPSLMQCSEINFKYTSTGFSAVRLRMFCGGTEGTQSTNLLLANTGNQFISGMESTDGQFDNQMQIKTKPGEAIAIQLEIADNQIELLVNGLSVQQYTIDSAKLAGSGLVIEPAGIWGNNTFPISLSTFSARSVPGRTWLPEVDSEIRNQVLTVPRFQKDDPPRHLLLAANGDVLRGEIEAATDTHFGFRCDLENLNVPRDRVRAVIWLKPPDPNAPVVPVAKAPVSPLDQRIQMRITFGGAQLSQYTSFLQSQVPDLRIKLPDSSNTRLVRMMIGGQSAREALMRICSRFDLRYRVDDDGTIVLENAAAPHPDDLARKTYWLKPDAIPATPPIQTILTGKGLTFPKGAFAQWEPKAGLFLMANTTENQTKLAALLASDFGGSLGSPTHWLQLTSGARLGLAVDKFGPDFIVGHHPIYGTVKIPMAQVYTIRTSAPEPTPTSKSLANWRLVNAPEPVIPDGSGEVSPLLGKAAAGFKLPLLEGGDFDLDGQKGQVVVLDFWATWCGPCIKSLPGLIDTVASFPAGRVKLIGINQGEAPEQVKHFLTARGLRLTVAMDADQGIGRRYAVDAIPHTVIVGPDGKVAWVQTGYSPDGEAEASDAIKKLLDAPSPADPPAKNSAP